MKKLMTFIAFALLTNAAMADQGKAPFYYSAEFRVADVQPMCPTGIPDGAVCMGLGSVVTLVADLGCMDELVFSEFKDVEDNMNINLYAVSVVKQHPRSLACLTTKQIKKTVLVTLPGFIELHNVSVQSH